MWCPRSKREKRAKVINAEGESLSAAALGQASDTMMAHPLALQLRNLQSLVEVGVDKSTTVCPAPLMSTIEELGSFLAHEAAAAAHSAPVGAVPPAASPPVTGQPIPEPVAPLPASNGSGLERPPFGVKVLAGSCWLR